MAGERRLTPYASSSVRVVVRPGPAAGGGPARLGAEDAFLLPAGNETETVRDIIEGMGTARFVHWQDHGMWLGYFEEFPDYLTQGESLEELKENLRDLYADLTGGEIPGIRRVADLAAG